MGGRSEVPEAPLAIARREWEAAARRVNRRPRRVVWVVVVGLVVATIVVGVLLLPSWLVGPQGDLSEADWIKSKNDARVSLIQAVAGLALFGGLIFTARTFTLNRQEQITDRFNKAVELLGSENVDVRTGAVFALQRLAVDSPSDRPAIAHVLAAFARRRSDAEMASEPYDYRARGIEELSDWWRRIDDAERALRFHGGGRREAATDVRAAVRVLVQTFGDEFTEFFPLDLRGVSIQGIDLQGSDLNNVDLTGADLSYAYLGEARLGNCRRVSFVGADLRFSQCWRLDEVDLSDAKLNYANVTMLQHARVERAEMNGAEVAKIVDVDLTLAKSGPTLGPDI